MGPRFRMGRRRGLVVGAAVGASVANSRNKKNQVSQDVNEGAIQQNNAQDSDQQFAEIEKLGQLKEKGLITQDEFDAKKKQILGL